MKNSRHVLLIDTSGKNMYLATRIKLSTTRKGYKKHLKYLKYWRKRNKRHLKQYGHKYYLENIGLFKDYYQLNKDSILPQQKHYRKKRLENNTKNIKGVRKSA